MYARRFSKTCVSTEGYFQTSTASQPLVPSENGLRNFSIVSQKSGTMFPLAEECSLGIASKGGIADCFCARHKWYAVLCVAFTSLLSCLFL